MAKLYPELVFTRGPQKGQRVPLSKTMNVLGRDRTCDVDLQDEYASRQHARIVIEGSRARLINTSPNGTRLNGKPVEQAVLNDGDLIGFGLEGEAKFEALPPAATAPLPKSAGAAPAEPAKPEAKAAGEPAPGKRRLKKPPAIVWVGVYLLGIALLFVILPKVLRVDDRNRSSAAPLTSEQIRAIIDRPLDFEPLNETLYQRNRDQAISGYEQWQTQVIAPDHLHRTLMCFKRALAYGRIKSFPPTEVHRLAPKTDDPNEPSPNELVQDLMVKVREALYEQVRVTYLNAYAAQRRGHWRDAQSLYHAVLEMVNDSRDPIHRNVVAQLTMVGIELQRRRDNPSRW